MKRLLIAGALCALTACAGAPAQLPGPGVAAGATVADEKALLGVELAYKTAQRSAEIAVDAGLVTPGSAAAGTIAAADTHAYLALRAARLAYQAGNAADINTATATALAAVQAFADALPKGK